MAHDPTVTDSPSDAAPAPGPDGSPPEAAEPSVADRPGGWRALGAAMAPRATRGQLLAALLCFLLGFAVVVQVQQTRSDDLAGLSQEELVRLLDEVTQRTESLEEQASSLRAQRAELASGVDSERAAFEAAAQRAQVQGILSGRLPAAGPGVRLVLTEPGRRLSAAILLDVLEELRNAGVEALQVNERRITASSYLVDTTRGVEVDGVDLTAPYVWLAIGDPDTIVPALEMPGGALATVRSWGGETEITALGEVLVDAVRDLPALEVATTAPSQGPEG